MGCGGEWACLGREMRYYVGFGAGSHCFFTAVALLPLEPFVTALQRKSWLRGNKERK